MLLTLLLSTTFSDCATISVSRFVRPGRKAQVHRVDAVRVAGTEQVDHVLHP